jgi:hypothetical protein
MRVGSRWRSLLVVVAGLEGLRCGGSVSHESAPVDAGTDVAPAALADAGPVEASGDTDAGADRQAGTGGFAPYSGTVTFQQCFGGGVTCPDQLVFSAFFASGASQAATCDIVTEGACAYWSCTGGNGASDSAGPITLSGGILSTPVVVDPVQGVYTYLAPASAGGRETLSVQAAGAAVPAFGPTSVVMPSPVQLLTPATPYAIATDADLDVTWAGGQSGVTFELQLTGGTQDAPFVSCEWAGGAGRGTVPAALLADLLPAGGAQLLYGQLSTTTFAAGPYTVAASATMVAMSTFTLH